MSHLLLEEKRIKLRKEVELAKQNLENNIDNIDPKAYLPSASDIIPDIITYTFEKSSNILSKAEPLFDLLPKNNKISSIHQILKIIGDDSENTI